MKYQTEKIQNSKRVNIDRDELARFPVKFGQLKDLSI